MERIKASVINSGEHVYVSIEVAGDSIRIPISKEDPKQVKVAFNRLIERLRAGVFTIDFQTTGEDLFSQVAMEYIEQLNREILEVHAEMEQYNLLAPREA